MLKKKHFDDTIKEADGQTQMSKDDLQMIRKAEIENLPAPKDISFNNTDTNEEKR